MPARRNNLPMTIASLKVGLFSARDPHRSVRYITIIAWCAIVLGSVLRISQLPTRVLFLDEAITQIGVAGHTDAAMIRKLYDGRPRTAETLRRDAEVDSHSSAQRLIGSLMQEDAQHPPLFYLAELGIVRVSGTRCSSGASYRPSSGC